MTQWIETKVSYEKTMEDGSQKKVTEPYLVDALSFTDAEKTIIKEVTQFISGDFDVIAVKKSDISEIIRNNAESADRWYKVKIDYITLDERSGVEKRKSSYFMVQASNFKNAFDTLNEYMGTMINYEIMSIAETKVMDVFSYNAETGESE